MHQTPEPSQPGIETQPAPASNPDTQGEYAAYGEFPTTPHDPGGQQPTTLDASRPPDEDRPARRRARSTTGPMGRGALKLAGAARTLALILAACCGFALATLRAPERPTPRVTTPACHNHHQPRKAHPSARHTKSRRRVRRLVGIRVTPAVREAAADAPSSSAPATGPVVQAPPQPPPPATESSAQTQGGPFSP